MNYSLSDCDHIIFVNGWGANMGVVTDDAISHLDQIRIVLASLVVLLPSMKVESSTIWLTGIPHASAKLKWSHSQTYLNETNVSVCVCAHLAKTVCP